MNPTSLTRRQLLRAGATATAAAFAAPLLRANTLAPRPDFDVRKYGAAGDGRTLDSAAFQRAIDAAAAARIPGRVLVPGGKRFLIGSVQLKAGIEFHLADDAELL